MVGHVSSIVFDTGVEEKPELFMDRAGFLGIFTGLRGRLHLGEDECVLFRMEFEGDHQFWMKDVFLSLDIIFINLEGFVVGIVENAPPLTEYPLSCGEYSWNVVETNAGFCEKSGIKKGTKVLYKGL